MFIRSLNYKTNRYFIETARRCHYEVDVTLLLEVQYFTSEFVGTLVCFDVTVLDKGLNE